MKNFKLLLATTAILSTGLAMGANAELSIATDSLTANIEASISVVEPATIQGGRIVFPTITTAVNGGRIVIKSDGTVDDTESTGTTAQLLHANENAYIDPIFISGSGVGYKTGFFNKAVISTISPSAASTMPDGVPGVNQAAWANSLVQMPTEIILTDVSNNASGTCGTVKNFKKGDAIEETRNDVSGVKIPFGATFELASDFHPNKGWARCTGNGVVTYFPSAIGTGVQVQGAPAGTPQPL